MHEWQSALAAAWAMAAAAPVDEWLTVRVNQRDQHSGAIGEVRSQGGRWRYRALYHVGWSRRDFATRDEAVDALRKVSR